MSDNILYRYIGGPDPYYETVPNSEKILRDHEAMNALRKLLTDDALCIRLIDWCVSQKEVKNETD